MNSTTARTLINAAITLEELLEALQTVERELEQDSDQVAPLAVRVDELVDVTSLPVFGGECPDISIGVWSYDAHRLLVGEGSWADGEIVDRDEWDE